MSKPDSDYKMIVDIFFRRENKNFKPENIFSDRFRVEVSAEQGTAEELDQILNSVWQQGARRGSHRSGIFEIQTDHGVWSQNNEKKLNANRPHLATFTDWENLTI